MTKSDVTVAALDIARIAGVGRAAVSNWRRRYPDFPQPVGGSASSPLFALGEIENWLGEHGKSFRMTEVDRLWQHLRTAVDDLQLGEFMGHLGALLVLVNRKPDAWVTPSELSAKKVAGELREYARAIPGEFPKTFPDAWSAIFVEAAGLAATDGAASTYEALCQQYFETVSRRGISASGEVAGLILDLTADLVPGSSSVLDPSCGNGNLLVAALARGLHPTLGQEADEPAARMSAARLLLNAHTDSGVRIELGDALRADAFEGQTVDLVVCDPVVERSWGYDQLIADPRWTFGLPPRSEPELAWLQHCLAHVRGGGAAAVVLPSAVAGRRAGRRIRGNLLRAGVVQAVIGLPHSSGLAGPRDLWILVRTDHGEIPQHVMLTDHKLDVTSVAASWRAFLRSEPLPTGARAVRVIDLLDDEIDLSPARHLVADNSVDRTYTELANQWTRILAGLQDALPAVDIGAPGPITSLTTVGELAKAGLISIQQAPIKMESEAGGQPVLTAHDVRHGSEPSGRGTPLPGAIELQPGDVVAPILREGRVRVVQEPGALLGSNLVMLRPDPDRIDPDLLAGCVRSAAQESSTRTSAASARFDIRRVAVPRLGIDEQRRWGAIFSKLATTEAQLSELAEVGRQLVRSARLGLIHGGLRPSELEQP
ncbi:type I restriction-modification system DNA methylase subunit [Kribbella sp. VKM Ac-2527]|uniref:Type I restriction-modification system DNA methylase subunit n=1 Tax=Kribbella caucasensis TaxID=2512215 RepID=A0A4R6J6W1_9ACTN|nr:N-6 DNA methylase [Kribbella sp. VKM Ac-2527]TDO30035.1 type I restriction-modification system DNA methylase subunit [Kribbella sp. VKM Ac-2527]